MSSSATLATAARVILQLRRDPRTVALVIVVPLVLIALLKGVFEGQPQSFNRIGGPLVGIFPLISMFLVTSITMLRERTSGTLERLMTLPLAKLDLLAGYGLAFAIVATIQGVVVAGVSFLLLDLQIAGSEIAMVGLAVLNALLGMALGLLASAFARTEFQAVQFMPAFILPQFLLCGLIVPTDQMAGVLEALSWILPMTWAYDALERVTVDGSLGSRGAIDVVVVLGATLGALALAALTLRRRTP
ncbi:MAG TPA: ABC transporter permease [Solirubrobacterales bacterium]|nr:ABC transporter permease [Solirubrobacterales bacterium]